MVNTTGLRATVVAAILAAGTVSMPAMAAENGALNYPAGSPGPFVGQFPPIPGVFMIAQTSFTTSDGLYDSGGDEIKYLDFSMDAWVETLRFVFSYPVQFAGAHVYSQVVVPLVHIDNSLSIDTGYGTIPLYDDDDAGLGNITVSPVILNWHLPNHQYLTAGLDIALEQGASYDENNLVNAGTGYTTLMPIVAYRYNNPQGFDAGVKLNLMFNLENDNTEYDTGDMVALDFTVGWHFGNWTAGIVGGYTEQFEKDSSYGVDVEDSELRSLIMGPSVTYCHGPIAINLNMQKGIIAENTSKSDSYWVNVAFPLYVPQPPMP